MAITMPRVNLFIVILLCCAFLGAGAVGGFIAGTAKGNFVSGIIDGTIQQDTREAIENNNRAIDNLRHAFGR